MKRKCLVLILLVSAMFSLQAQSWRDNIAEGDIIFQTSHSGQSRLVAMATHSPYTHCGIILKRDGQWQVLEAVEPVKYTPLDTWISHGDSSHFYIRRLKDKPLSAAALSKIKLYGDSLLGKHYDLLFSWKDNTIYCSELVWKVYKKATGLEVGRLQQLKDFDVSNPAIQMEMKRRYGGTIPWSDYVISPASIFESSLLGEVVRR